MGLLLSVNLARVRPNPSKPDAKLTGIDKQPVDHPVEVRAPGPKRGGMGSGLVGDRILDTKHHGGDDQAVYAYARESLDLWEAELGRELRSGAFGENLTTAGVEVDGARIGEIWRIGDRVRLEVAVPRVPCATFAAWLDEKRWAKRFTKRALPGAYLRVVEPGEIRKGDPIVVEHRPAHEVTIALCFRALMNEADLLPALLAADALPEEVKERAREHARAEVAPLAPSEE